MTLDAEGCRVTGGPYGVDRDLKLCAHEKARCGRAVHYELHHFSRGSTMPQPSHPTTTQVCKEHGDAWMSDDHTDGRWRIGRIFIEEDAL